MKNEPGAEYKAVRGLIRGLDVLQTLNRSDGGGASIAYISEKTGLHRTTIRRLLESLQSEGYVRRSDSDDSYRLCIKVRELSEGFKDEQWISQLVAPLLGDLLQKVVWPTDLCTLDVDAMVIRETTHRFSRLSFHRSMVGRRLPMLLTATGRAYLANCDEQERQQILRLLATRDDEQARVARDAPFVDNLLRKVRHLGYGFNYGDWEPEKKIGAIALPVRREQSVIACLNLVYIAKAMPVEVAAQRYLPAMKAVVARIEQALLPNPPQDAAE